MHMKEHNFNTLFSNTVGCNSNPCLHGGICKGTANGYTCTCKDHYNGSNCESEYLFSHVAILIYVHS